jgi:hypothetical protein
LGLVVCGGVSEGVIVSDEIVSDVWRLDLATLRWEPMPALVNARQGHACCVVRGALVVLGGSPLGGDGPEDPCTSSVEMLSSEEGAEFVELPPLSCGGLFLAAAFAVEESDSEAGQVLLIGGLYEAAGQADAIDAMTSVQLVDLATGVCVPQNNLPWRWLLAAGRLPDGRVVCAGGTAAISTGAGVAIPTGAGATSAEVWGPPPQGAVNAAWRWRELPAMSAERWASCGCVMTDGRFAVLGGSCVNGVPKTSCEALTVDGDIHWEPLPPMHDARSIHVCGLLAGCVIVAGGRGGLKSAELYDEERKRWLRLPCDFALRRWTGWDGQRGSIERFRERCTLQPVLTVSGRASTIYHRNTHTEPRLKCEVMSRFAGLYRMKTTILSVYD